MRVRAALLVLLAAVSLAACGSSSSTSHEPSALARWDSAYRFLSAQTKPTQIVCNWLTNTAGSIEPVAHVAAFYNFSDTAAWKTHIVTRDDMAPSGTFELCEADIPTTVPYGPAIETFLRGYGLTFVAHPLSDPHLTRIEITYAGQNARDPDIIYRDKPGLFGLENALHQLGAAAFVPGTSKIIQPTNNAGAMQYLTYAKPLLDWYGYSK